MAATDATVQTWEVILHCIRKLPNGTYTDHRKVLLYYVKASGEQEAVDLAMSWLPRKYDLMMPAAALPSISGERS